LQEPLSRNLTDDYSEKVAEVKATYLLHPLFLYLRHHFFPWSASSVQSHGWAIYHGDASVWIRHLLLLYINRGVLVSEVYRLTR